MQILLVLNEPIQYRTHLVKQPSKAKEAMTAEDGVHLLLTEVRLEAGQQVAELARLGLQVAPLDQG